MMTIQNYVDELPQERINPFVTILSTLEENLPQGFEKQMCYNMPSFVVPHSLYPAGYHCDPKIPLPFISVASMKAGIHLYHMGMYADDSLMEWWINEYKTTYHQNPDIGKSCIRFKKMNLIPWELIAQLARKMTPMDWVSLYEKKYRS